MEEVFNGTYGSSKTPCKIYVYNGWYCVKGSAGVNRTHEELFDGVDVEELEDYDFFTWSSEINSYAELVEAVEN